MLNPKNYRIGNGIDVHKLVQGEKFILGGIQINSNNGILAHSDGDILIHALVDSILGALSLGDLGTHFPSSDAKWKDADSIIFINEVMQLMENQNYQINNIDITIILQRPAIKPNVPDMRENIANACHIPIESVSIKATTTDGLGSIGRGEGIAASAVVLLSDASNAS